MKKINSYRAKIFFSGLFSGLFSALFSALFSMSALFFAPNLQAADVETAKAVDAPATEVAAADPFAFGDFTWLNGNSRLKTNVLDTKYVTGQFMADMNYIYDFAKPKVHTLVGSTNAGRTNEFELEQLGVGGDFHVGQARGRLMTQFGISSTMTPRNDGSPTRGQWIS